MAPQLREIPLARRRLVEAWNHLSNPSSFVQDSTGDGVGHLNGITARLDYFIWLGVNVIWISPVYPSPMADFGYDVSDYWRINPPFGTFVDFDRLLAGPPATTQDHPQFCPKPYLHRHLWFEESRLSRGSAKRDWYIWRGNGGATRRTISVQPQKLPSISGRRRTTRAKPRPTPTARSKTSANDATTISCGR